MLHPYSRKVLVNDLLVDVANASFAASISISDYLNCLLEIVVEVDVLEQLVVVVDLIERRAFLLLNLNEESVSIFSLESI